MNKLQNRLSPEEIEQLEIGIYGPLQKTPVEEASPRNYDDYKRRGEIAGRKVTDGGTDTRLEPPENVAAREAADKDSRSRWKRKNKWGATTGDPFKEVFGKSLTDLTKENSDVPFMYRHLVEQNGGDHNQALGALADA